MRYRYIYKYKTGLTKVKTKLAIAFTAIAVGTGGILGSIAIFGGAHAAGGYTLFDDATLVNPGNASNTAVQLSYISSSTQTDGGINFTVPSGMTVNQLTNLSTDYKFTAGTCGQGSPRFQINVLGENVFVYLGPQFPNPNSTPCAGASYINSGNVISSTSMVDATQLSNGYETWADFQTQHSTDAVTGVQLVVDGFTTDNITAQFDNVAINNTTFDFEPVLTSPSTANDCKNGGWQTFNNPTFSNQGLCVSWVQHNILGHGTPAIGKPSH
jgi:hypothetical protein